MLYKATLRPTIFALSSKDPERSHEWTISLLHYIGKLPWLAEATARFMTVKDPVDLLGLHFPNRVGLAAGFDKNARAVWGLSALGFGFIELGTVTAQKQPGNPRPRIWRFPRDKALINAMGFNNHGADEMARTLSSSGRPPIPIGISIGKSRVVPPENLEAVIQDHLYSLRMLYPYGDYFVLNVSSPNTPGLRGLQNKDQLDALIGSLRKETVALEGRGFSSPKPLLVKIAPDLTPYAIDDVLKVCADQRIGGLIATNTTLSRVGLTTPTDVSGGLSGKPLTDKSLLVVQHIRKRAPNLVIIGVGGIMTVDDAQHMIDAGANLVQLYTGFVYQGPLFPRRVSRGIRGT